jgi:Holliday junction DNA helicase RuvA
VISRISGVLRDVADDAAIVENGGVAYEVMLPSALAERLKSNGALGDSITLETIYYIEAGDKKASHFPRLVGFTDPVDREFFSLMTQVPGLGVKKALRSLVLPIREIAEAIETRDPSTLSRLPGVGSRLAEKIIAELNGKTTKFALSRTEEPLAVARKQRQTPLFEDTLEVLLQLQYNRQEAEQMINKAIKANPKVNSPEKLIEIIFRAQQEKAES